MQQNQNALTSARDMIVQGKASCIVLKDGDILHMENSRGVGPIIAMYEQGLLTDAVVVDKIIGKAAAMISVLGGATGCYGLTMSRAAVEYLKAHGVHAEYDVLTDHIINRKGDGICPMEQTVAEIDDPQEALIALKAKIQALAAHAPREGKA